MIYFDGNDLLIGIGVLFFLLPVLWLRKRSLSYLLFFSIFWMYLLAVVAVVIFPFTINMDYGIFSVPPNINLIPFYFGGCFRSVNLCVRSIIENIILTIPFGFGINFLIKIKSKNFFWLAILVGFVFEFSQLVISLTGSGFRATDINDVILNAIGVLIGYALFRLFAWAYLKTAKHFNFKNNWLLADIQNVVLQTQDVGRSKIT